MMVKDDSQIQNNFMSVETIKLRVDKNRKIGEMNCSNGIFENSIISDICEDSK